MRSGTNRIASGPFRDIHIRYRSSSSSRWKARQKRDPFAREARERPSLRSRASFKLAQIHAKHNILTRGANVIDLGANPGGWSKVARDAVGNSGVVVAVDLLPMKQPPGGVRVLQGSALDETVQQAALQLCGGRVDVVLSDMAPNTCGNAWLDHVRSMELCEAARAFATSCLVPGGVFLCKYFRGEDDRELLDALGHQFKSIKTVKPSSSRSESREAFVLALDFNR